jgi:hypothetical protein
MGGIGGEQITEDITAGDEVMFKNRRRIVSTCVCCGVEFTMPFFDDRDVCSRCRCERNKCSEDEDIVHDEVKELMEGSVYDDRDQT